jgi:tetratricopeptide (TPR) repeat protein
MAAEVSAGRGGTSPIEDYRQALYQEAIRGLTYESGFVEFAEDAQEVLAEVPPGTDAATLVTRGAAELEQNIAIAAIKTLTLAVLLDPEVPAAYQGLGRAFLGKGKTEEAIACFRSALRLDPNLIDTRFELALTYWRQADYQEAIETWRHVLTLDPNHARTHERLSIALYYLGDYKDAWRHVHAAEALDQEVPPQFRRLLEARMPEPQS